MRDLVDRPLLPAIAIALLAIAILAFLGRVQPTVPEVQDEFSYLLAADTYAHGRLTNPTNPLWRYFEVAHVLQQPTYQSKYPPGQGLVLALGQTLTGTPLAGVWLGLALASGAVCWMLRAWLPPPWALLGGLLAATHGAVLRAWGASYMGGAVAMFGGALLVGALARGVEDPRPRYGVLIGAGLAVLAMTRPFEGLVASLPAALVLLVWAARRYRASGPRRDVHRLLVPLVATLLATGAWMAYYDWRVTGSPWQLPYQAYLAQHEDDVFTHPRAEELGEERVAYLRRPFPERVAELAIFHLGDRWFLALPLVIALPALLRRRWARFALLTAAMTLVAAALTYGSEPHYSAPAAALLLGLLAESLAVIAGWLGGRRGAPLVVTAFLALWWLGSSRIVADDIARLRHSRIASQSAMPPSLPIPKLEDDARRPERLYWRWFTQVGMPVRQVHLDRLTGDGGRHLVLVQYVAGSTRHREWAYNGADIDADPVVWARWLPNQPLWPLLAHFPDRHVWYVVPERDPWELLPFPVDQVGTWYLRRHEGAAAEIEPTPTATEPVRLEISQAGEKAWHLQLERAFTPLEAGREYSASFRARADAPRGAIVGVSQAHPPFEPLGERQLIRLDTEWRTFAYGFRATSDEPVPRLLFSLGGSDAAVEITDVRVPVR